MNLSLILLVVSLTHTIVAIDYRPKVLQYCCQSMQNSTTEYWGIIAKSKTGTLDCYVTYNSRTMSYSGALNNNKYAPEQKWLNQPLGAVEAKYYYEQLVRIKKNQ